MKKIVLSLIAILALGGIGYYSFAPKKAAPAGTKKTIVLGTSPGPYSDLFLERVKPMLEKEGYHVTVKSFNSLLNADIALSEGQIDLNVDQHTAYMADFNSNRNANLTALTTIPTIPTGIYPGSKKTLDQVADGDKIGIPQDNSNAARAYKVLVKAGWITLKPGTNLLKVTKADIQANPHHLQIVGVDEPTLARSVNDFDYVVMPGSAAYAAKISTNTMILPETISHDFQLVATVNATNKETAWAKAVTRAYQSQAFQNDLEQHHGTTHWDTQQHSHDDKGAQ